MKDAPFLYLHQRFISKRSSYEGLLYKALKNPGLYHFPNQIFEIEDSETIDQVLRKTVINFYFHRVYNYRSMFK